MSLIKTCENTHITKRQVRKLIELYDVVPFERLWFQGCSFAFGVSLCELIPFLRGLGFERISFGFWNNAVLRDLCPMLKSLEWFEINHCGFPADQEEFEKLVSGLKESRVLRLLRFGDVHIPPHLDTLLFSLVELQTLRVLDLTKAGLNNGSLARLATYLPRSQLEVLYLGENSFGPTGISVLSTALPSTLKTLFLSNCDLGSASAPYICNLIVNSKLRLLTLYGAYFTSHSLHYIGIGIKASLTLREIHLPGSLRECIGDILPYLHCHRSMQDIWVDGIDDVDVNFVKVLRYLRRLQSPETIMEVDLCSSKMIPRLGANSAFAKYFPKDLIRNIRVYLF
jgi:hypothetical protein